MKQQATVWEKILANHISEKGLVLKIKKNSKSSKVKKKQSNYQMGKRHAQTFHWRGHRKMFKSAIRKMQIKITMQTTIYCVIKTFLASHTKR